MDRIEPRTWSPRRKADLILAVLKGRKTLAGACQENGLSEAWVEGWIRAFLKGGEQGLGALADEEEPESREVAPMPPGDPPSSRPGDEPDRSQVVDATGAQAGSEPAPGPRRVRRRKRRRKRQHQGASTRRSSRVVRDMLWAASPVLLGILVGVAALILNHLGYFDSGPPPE